MHKINTVKNLLSLFIIPLLLATGCSKKKLDNDTLYFNLGTEPPTLDPNLTADSTSGTVIQNIFDGLVAYDVSKPELPIVPKVAKSWKISKNGAVYTFFLRDDVYWSDGKKVTAYDFEYSWKRLITAKTAAEYAYFLFDVKNAHDFNSGKIKDFSKVGIKALNAHTFQVTLKKPVAYFIHIPNFPVLSPLRQDIIEKWGEQWTDPKHIVTNGPYKLARWRHDYELVMERNEKYFDTKAKTKRIHCYMIVEASTTLSLYETGKLDILRTVPAPDIPRIKNLPEFHSENYFSNYHIGLNTQKPPLNNVYVRRALNAAVDRKEVVAVIGDAGQIPTSSLIPTYMVGHNQNIGIPFDKKKAEDWMSRAGYRKKETKDDFIWVHKASGKPFPVLQYIYNTNEDHKTIAENLQAQWKKNLGIRVELQNQEWKVYIKMLTNANTRLKDTAFHLYRMGWIADYPDPDNFATLFTSYNENNHTGFGPKKYDELVDRAKSITNPEKRQKFYDEIQKLLIEEHSAIIPIYVYAFQVMYRNEVKDVFLNSVNEWHLDRIWLSRK